MKRVLLIVALAACGSKKPAVSNSGGAVGSAAAATAGQTYTLKAVNQGDDSCYLDIVDDKGTAQTVPADFELCPGGGKDASKLIGFPVALTWGKANVLSASCEGNVDCGKSDNIDIVESVTPTK